MTASPTQTRAPAPATASPEMTSAGSSAQPLVVVLVSLEGVLHYREQWKNYRSTEQYLGREEQWFRAGVGPYKQHAADPTAAVALLVERTESAIASENAATLSVMTLGPERSGG